MTRNEKYIAYTRALSELVLVIDNEITGYDDGSIPDITLKKRQKSSMTGNKKGNPRVLNYKRK